MIDHILGHETDLNRFQTTEVVQGMFSDNSKIKLELNNRKMIEESLNTYLKQNYS